MDVEGRGEQLPYSLGDTDREGQKTQGLGDMKGYDIQDFRGVLINRVFRQR